MKRVLIVSPRFPPINAADHQRVRMMLPTLAEHGWQAVVLAVDPEFVEGPLEPDLLLTIPSDAQVVRCRAVSPRLTRRAGIGSLALRSIRSLGSAGDHLLRRASFDLVFFSTTEFGVLPLGRRWKRKFGTPFVIDLQDPWVNSHYAETGQRPPGGEFKHRVTQAVAGFLEGRTLREAAHIVSVSPRYPEVLRRRYPDLVDTRFSVIPFGGSREDFEVARATEASQSIFSPGDGRRHWLYAGTAPPGIRNALTGLLLAFKRAIESGIVEPGSTVLHFVGTDYALAAHARERVAPIARELGMGSSVAEHPARIAYFQTLRCLRDADALLVLGWDDPGYTASKIYPYILAERPLLSVLHEDSSANDVIRRTGSGVGVSFNGGSATGEIAERIFEQWFVSRAFDKVPATRWDEFAPYTAETMTKRVAEVFDRVSSDKSLRRNVT